MGEFVGKRVVPDHVGVWNQKKTYEPLMIVLDGETGDSYISRKAVPTQRDFFGLSIVADVSGNVAEIASVRDEVRKNNLIVMKQVILKNEENEPLWTSNPVGALNLGATMLNGQLGPTAGTYAVQISSPFMLDKEKDYTLFLLDERKNLEYSVYLLDETTWKDVMENGVTRAFNVIHSPCGLIPAHQTGKHQLRNKKRRKFWKKLLI